MEIAKNARQAALKLAVLDTETRNDLLIRMASQLEADAEAILAANAADCVAAEQAGLSQALYDRLKLDGRKLAQMAQSVRAVAKLPDPVGKVQFRMLLDDGLELHRVSCPLGVLAVIFESRPDAVTQISSLALKSANAVILKGGREAQRSTAALVDSIHKALQQAGIPTAAVAVVTDRTDVDALLAMDEYIDLVIPRGSNSLVRYVQAHTRIPVLGHAEGICHVYVDKAADLNMAVEIVFDAKTQYPAACNAAETLLVHKDVADAFLPSICSKLASAGVQLRGCLRSKAVWSDMELATEDDWRTEYCGLVISIKIVDSIEDAVAHINDYGSHHTDTIVTEDRSAAEFFMAYVDSAGVFHNASTRFSDGYRYGFGAEVGISTSKIHARGPVGLEGLVSYKYKLYGSGQTVALYSGPEARPFKHIKLDT
ncbi:MAG: glutamate-5-semialdehyde dehydrogenase [Acidobacteriota bacterium]|nr:glutamate-5-semialdehyde dehydrogenase [Blastocatellia bacterium]MDW8413586.1 glutamate-5-semialdehyde dehydrogenase [Acidobacteriota bacterium]